MVSDINQILSQTNDQIETFKSNIHEIEDADQINNEEFDQLIQSLKESNEAFQQIHQMDNIKVTIHPEIKLQLMEAIEYFLHSKDAKEKVGALQNTLGWSILEQFKNLHQHLKTDEKLKRGQRVEKVDLDEL